MKYASYVCRERLEKIQPRLQSVRQHTKPTMAVLHEMLATYVAGVAFFARTSHTSSADFEEAP